MAERELIYRLKVDSKTGKLELSQFQNELETTTKKAESSASRIRTAFDNTAKSMSEIGKGLSVGVTLPLVALGAAALKAGQDFDDAFDGIRIATGATGQELEGLQDSFRNIFENVPDSADKVSKAIGELNTRLGLSGPSLEALTTQILNLSRLTGEDLTGVIEGSTRAFGAWSIATEDQSKTLDYLFKVSQETGVGVTSLLQKVTQFAPVFREMGFSIEESAALLGKWEKEGVNAEAVLSGLRIAAGKFAKEGVSLRDGLAAIVDQIQKLGPGAKSTALAVEIFGKSGVTMADAILKGRLSVDDLVKTLKNSPETINKAAEATAGFAEKFVILKNRLLSALEPLGTELLTVLERDVVPAFMDAIEGLKTLIKWFSDLPGPVKTAAIAFAAFAAVLGPLLLAMAGIVSWAGNIAATFATLAPKMIALTGATTGMEAAAIGLGTALRFVGSAVAVVAVAFAAWEIGKWIAQVTGLDEAFYDLGKQIFTTHEATMQMATVIGKLNATLKIPLIMEAGESWDHYAQRVQKAAFEQSGIAEKLKKTTPEVKKVDEVTTALNKVMLGNAKASKDAQKEIDGWGDALGLAIPKLKETVANGEKYVAYLKKNKTEAVLVKEAELKLIEAKQNLKKALDALSGPQIKNIGLMEDAVDLTGDWQQSLQVVNPLLNILGKEHLKNINDKLKETNERLFTVNGAFKTLGVTSTAELRKTADEADLAFQTIRDSGTASAQDVLRAQKAAIEAIVKAYKAAGSEVPKEIEKMVADIDKELGELPKAAKNSADGMRQEISTVFNDLSKGIADSIVEWKGFWETLKSIGKDFAKSVLRIFIDDLLSPLTKEGGIIDQMSGKLQEQFSKLTNSIGGFFKDIFGKIGGFLKNFLSSTAGQIAGAVAGVGAAIAGLKLGGTKGALLSVGGGALSGASIGTMIAPGIGTAIGAAVGAAAGGLAALVKKFTQRGKEKLEATAAAEELSRYVWQEVIPQVKAGLIGVEDGEKAIQAAFDAYEKYLRDNLKDQTVIARSIETQRITLTQGLAALAEIKKDADKVGSDLEADVTEQIDKLAKAGMEGIGIFLDEISKTGFVSDDVIQGLKDIADAMKETGREAEISASSLALLGAEFIRTGVMTDDFAAAIQGAGGSVEFFNEVTSQIQGLQGLRAEFAGLKQAIDALLPKQKTWQEEFLDTGVITDEMAEKIRKAGGDIEQFKKFASMKGVKSEFDSLIDEFNRTGVASDRLLELIMQFGGPESVASFKKLMEQAKASGKTIGDLAKESDGAANVIQGAFESTGQGIDKAFTDAAKTLSDTLQEMDDNLGKAIASLQTAMVTMIKNLIDVLLGVPGAAEKAARDANFFLSGINDIDVRVRISSTFDDSGMREAESRASILDSLSPTMGQPDIYNPIDTTYTPGSRETVPAETRIPRFAEGTPFVPQTGLAIVHRGERIIPAHQNSAMGGEGLTQTINFYNVEDPNEQKRLMDRVNRQVLNDLRRS